MRVTWWKLKVSLLLFILKLTGFSCIDEEMITPLLKKLLDKSNYERSSIPIRDGKPLQAKVRIWTNDMVPQEQLDMHFSIDFFLTIMWNDYRLKYDISGSNGTNLPFDYKILEDIWSPNLYFPETKAGLVGDIPQPNIMVMLADDGGVILNFKILVTFFCELDLTLYPFDVQRCNLTLESYSYGLNFLNLSWDTTQVYNSKMTTQDFDKILIETKERISIYTVGEWKTLVLMFTLYRNAPLYLIRDFLPCTLIVMLSWINFWINFRSTPARTALGITTVLTIVTMTNNVRNNSPSSSGLFRSIDFYMLACNLFVFAALFEGALVGMMAPNEKHVKDTFNNTVQKMIENTRKLKKVGMADIVSSAMTASKREDTTTIDEERNIKTTKKRKKAGKNNHGSEEVIPATIIQRVRPITTETFKIGPFNFYKGEIHIVDRISRLLFPFLFLLFNFTFFIVHHFEKNSVL